jgi:hypothetical protein
VRIYHWIWLGLFAQLLAWSSATAAVPATDTLFPKTTVGYLSVPNYGILKDHWRKTQLGKLVADPVMEPFTADLREQFQKRWSDVYTRLGLKIEDLKGVVAGETGLAFIAPKPGEAALAILADVSGNGDKARKLLAKAEANLTKAGATATQRTLGGATVTVYQMPANAEGVQPQTIYFLEHDFLGATDNLQVAADILDRLSGGQTDCLAAVSGYRGVMKRVAADAGDSVAQARWFLYPLGYAEAIRAATPKKDRRRGKSFIEVLRHQGCAAMQGIGGRVDFATDGYELIHRTAIYAPGPFSKSMKMLKTINGKDFAPQSWVSANVATYTTFYFDVRNAFDNFGPAFDEVVGEGEEGAWKQTLESLEQDPNGPQINLREELIKHLGPRITMVTDYEEPITTKSERLLFALECKDEKATAAAVKKAVTGDQSMKRRVIDGQVIWEIVEEAEAKVPSITLDVPSISHSEHGERSGDDTEATTQGGGHILPHGAITVANGHLLVASNLDYLLKVLKPLPKEKQLAQAADFQQVWKTLDKLGLDQQCMRSFSRTASEFRPSYELIRQGKMPESQTLLARTLNSISGAAKKGVPRKQRIQGQNLPEFKVVAKALGTAGTEAIGEKDGWFIKGVLLPNPQK